MESGVPRTDLAPKCGFQVCPKRAPVRGMAGVIMIPVMYDDALKLNCGPGCYTPRVRRKSTGLTIGMPS
jgi:hypothetical protein